MSYKDSFNKHTSGVKSLKWITATSQILRFKQLVNDIDFSNKSVLDVGCGFGDLIPHIATRADKFSYIGVDREPDFINEARKRYPEYKFILRDYFNNPLDESFDVIICSGALNHNDEDAIQFRKNAIELMFRKSDYCTIFNMAGYHPVPQTKSNSTILYVDSLSILEHCLNLTTKIVFKQHYHNRDFAMYLFH